MSAKRIGLVLSVSRLWMMSLPFRLGSRSRAPGFAPGARNLLVYELRRLGHWLYERERLAYHVGGLRSVLSRVFRRH
jgi:hypothetical protein